MGLVPARDWTDAERLQHEKAAIGYYLSGHPFAGYAAELARKLELARTTVQSRLARLEQSRTIVGYTVVVPDEAEAALVRAHVLITARPKQGAAIEAALRRIAEVRTLHSVSGPFDLIAVLAADSIGALDRLIDRIGELEGVERTTSAIVLSTRIAR